MDAETLAVKLAEADSLARENSRRIATLEGSIDILTRLVTSVEVMASKLQQISEKVDKLDEKVSDLESEPGKLWKSIVEKSIWAVVAAVIAFILGRFGIP